MVLVGADEEGAGKAVEAVQGGVAGGLLQPQAVAFAAAVVDVIGHGAAELPQAVILLHDQLHAHGGGVGHQRVAARLVFLIGVDVGVVPVGHRLDALRPEQLDAGHGAGRTAGVQQRFGHLSFLFLKGMCSSSFSGLAARARGCIRDRKRAQT